MRRREFISLISSVVVWPLAARAQQSERARRVGVLMFLAEDDPGSKSRLAAFIEGLQQLNWDIGRNVQIDIRWTASDPVHTRKYAAELATIAPDVILATGSESVAALREATRTLPIVFTGVTDREMAGITQRHCGLCRPYPQGREAG
jgi:putative ABC transport system substrate-binding protein